jgi:transcription elongation GreA/GreB family factor
MSNQFYLTRKGRLGLMQQRDQLREQLHASTKEMGESVKRDNDLRENPEFLQLQTKISYELPNKISELTRILATAKLIEETDAIRTSNFDEVLPGMQVELIDAAGGNRVISILGYAEGNPEMGIVSYLTPVAKALIHKSVGDEVSLINNGKLQTYEIFDVRRSPYL